MMYRVSAISPLDTSRTQPVVLLCVPLDMFSILHLIFRQRALRKPLHIGKQGNISQLGGEFILGPRTYILVKLPLLLTIRQRQYVFLCALYAAYRRP